MSCPSCSSNAIKRNGHIHNGKQNHRCKDCGRQFVLENSQKLVSAAQKETINKLLLEKISLAGICRVVQVSEAWLQGYVSELYAAQPDDLNAEVPTLEAMQGHLEDKFDEYVYQIGALKKTLHRLSVTYHGRVLGHLTRS